MNKPTKRWQQLHRPILITIVGLLILIFILIGLIKNIRRVFSVKQEIKQLSSEINRLDKKNQEVDNLVSYLDSKEFLEEEARLKFDLRQPNEQIIIVKQSEDASQTSAMTDSIFDLPIQKKDKIAINHNPNLWFKYFFNSK